MTENDIPIKPDGVGEALGEMKIEENTITAPAEQSIEQGQEPQFRLPPSPADCKDSAPQCDGGRSPRPTRSSRSQTPLEMKSKSRSQTPQLKSEEQSPTEVIDGDISITQEPNKSAKLSRKATQKFTPREPPLFSDYEDSTEEATSKFHVIRDCIYGSKYMGSADHDALGCDCNEEFRDGVNHACGEDSDCINRLTKIECLDEECHCGANCQNQRFQRKQFAKVSVIKTEKKGYGLHADTDLHANDFIFEYIGEVINEPTFRRRTIQYDEEGIKHFYFMSLTKSEFVDATKKGNLGRFCNHSCNPNSYVDKWVVGDKLRMGIFAERDIKAGEELVFNYNVDRYGADPTPCYCGEPNCTGFLGGKTQTERATKLSHTTIEALGIDDGDGWDLAVAKKPRKKETGEDDEEYVSNVQPKPLDHKGIAALMGTLMQCKEKWIVVKLLDRILKAGDEKIYQKVVQFHGYTILRSAIGMWKEDNNVILQILDILYKLPRVSKNKIVDSKIEPSIQELTTSEHEDIAFEAKRLLEDWSKLELAYRIPRKKFDADAAAANLEMMKKVDPEGYARMMNQFAPRRDTPVENKVSTPSTPNPIMNAPTGPRGTMPQRGPVRMVAPVVARRPGPLPSGWYPATDSIGRTYYYSKAGSVTWQRPTVAAYEAPAAKPSGLTKAQQDQKSLQAIIDSITKEEAKPVPRESPRPELESPGVVRKKPEEKWRSLPLAKQQKIYETTLAPTVQYLMNKYTKKLPKEDLKRFAKDISKKMVASDYKRGRVEDPTYIDRAKEKQVKVFVAEFFDKAVKKRREHEKKKKEKKVRDTKMSGTGDGDDATPKDTPTDTPIPTPLNGNREEDDEEVLMDMSEDEDAAHATMRTGGSDDTDESRKRKHDAEHGTGEDAEAKRMKDTNGHAESPMDTPPPPPPPPPPPSGTPTQKPQDLPPIEQEMQLMQDDGLPPIELEMAMSLQGTPEEVKESSEERELRAAQEALEKENAEAAAEEAQAPVTENKVPAMEMAAQLENPQ